LALASCPRVLLLDEPLAGLAAAERDRIAKLIMTLSGHMAILMVEHDIDRAFEIAGHITVMHEGRVLASGTPEDRAQPRGSPAGLSRPRHRRARACRNRGPCPEAQELRC
jgi:branched-chain amino acid transport system ATP-binding protein